MLYACFYQKNNFLNFTPTSERCRDYTAGSQICADHSAVERYIFMPIWLTCSIELNHTLMWEPLVT